MDSHLRYLDELILAIQELGFDPKDRKNNDSLISPTIASNEEDAKNCKILNTLMENLQEDSESSIMKNDEVFAKTLEALDSLLTKRPYLLYPPSKLAVGEYKGIVNLMDKFLEVSIVNFDIKHRLWFLRKKLAWHMV